MKYLPLLHLSITHDYYADGRCFDFRIEPTAPTQRLIRNHRCVIKARSNGVQIFAPVSAEDALFIPLPQNATFAFYLYLDNPEFSLFTELTAISQLAAPLFTNDGASPGAPVQLRLVSRDLTSGAGGRSSPRPARGSFAEVEIHRGNSVSDLRDGPANFEIAFEAKRIRWVYYLLAQPADGPYTITDGETDGVRFSDENRRDLSQNRDPEDRVGEALATRYPNRRWWRFLSDEPVPCQQRARRAIRLSQNGSSLIDALPNPSLQNYNLIAVENSTDLQRAESLYQIINRSV
jgi:hypothetical protein